MNCRRPTSAAASAGSRHPVTSSHLFACGASSRWVDHGARIKRLGRADRVFTGSDGEPGVGDAVRGVLRRIAALPVDAARTRQAARRADRSSARPAGRAQQHQEADRRAAGHRFRHAPADAGPPLFGDVLRSREHLWRQRHRARPFAAIPPGGRGTATGRKTDRDSRWASSASTRPAGKLNVRTDVGGKAGLLFVAQERDITDESCCEGRKRCARSATCACRSATSGRRCRRSRSAGAQPEARRSFPPIRTGSSRWATPGAGSARALAGGRPRGRGGETRYLDAARRLATARPGQCRAAAEGVTPGQSAAWPAGGAASRRWHYEDAGSHRAARAGRA